MAQNGLTFSPVQLSMPSKQVLLFSRLTIIFVAFGASFSQRLALGGGHYKSKVRLLVHSDLDLCRL